MCGGGRTPGGIIPGTGTISPAPGNPPEKQQNKSTNCCSLSCTWIIQSTRTYVLNSLPRTRLFFFFFGGGGGGGGELCCESVK